MGPTDTGRCGVDRSVLCRLCLVPEERKRGSSGLCAVRASRRTSRRYFKGRQLEEREREISNKALLAGFRGLWIGFIGFVLPFGFIKGWDTSVTKPMWALSSAIWWAAMLVLRVEAITTLVVYRRGAHV